MSAWSDPRPLGPPPLPIDALPESIRPLVAGAFSEAHDQPLVGFAISLALLLAGSGIIQVDDLDMDDADADDRALLASLMARMDEHDRSLVVGLQSKFEGMITAATGGRPVLLDTGGIFTRDAGAKVPRNDPCPCGSGQKWKRCCGR